MSDYGEVWAAARPYMRARKNDVHIPLSFGYAQRLLEQHPEADADVVLLAQAFAARIATRMARTIEPPSAEDVACLRSYGWPGNVRELQNVIERAVITSVGGRLAVRRFLPQVATASASPRPSSAAVTSVPVSIGKAVLR